MGAAGVVVQPPHFGSSRVALGYAMDLVGKAFGPAIPGNACEVSDLASVPLQGTVWETVEP